jgi:hypothetical protein
MKMISKEKLMSFMSRLRKMSRSLFREKSQGSLNWFFKEIRQNQKSFPKNSFEIVKELPPIGSMIYFIYDPKYKNELPYWDRCPMALVLSHTENGFLAFNFHYLPPTLRAYVLDKLMRIRRGSPDNRTYMEVSYLILKRLIKFPILAHCTKRYLSSHVRSRIVMINIDQWENIIYLPTQQFRKATAQEVWSDI